MKVITSHINADFDSFASMVAARRLYPDAKIVFPGSQERKLRDFIEVFHPVEILRLREVPIEKIDTLIIVDTKQPDRLGPLAAALKNRNISIHVYDHHPFEKDDIRGEVEKIEEVGATTTIFTEILRSRKLDPTPMEATILALGIYEETGSLLFPSTTERDLLAASYLLRKGANLNIVSEYIRTRLDIEELDLLNELIKSARELVITGIRVLIANASRDSYIGDAAHLAHRIMDLEDIDAVILILGMEGKVVIVGRSRVPELDVGELLQKFGGGGHEFAASATVKEASPEVVSDRIMGLLPEHVKARKTASDIMTSPVITIPWDNTLKTAEDLMTKYGVNVLPVVRDNAYGGLISRETVEKAIFHGFRKKKVVEFSSSDALTVGVDEPLRRIEALMIEHNQRFMPVLEGDQIVGAITRTDLLRVLYEEFLRRRRIDKDGVTEPHVSQRNLATWLRDRFPAHVHSILRQAGEIADTQGVGAYVVGGSVRDLLLGQANLDIDLVIEGDGIAFARQLAEAVGGRVRAHKRFGTAQVITDRLRLDVATARTEYYESPAALPKVQMSSIKKDLYRRDFTINTLAIKLNSRDFGRLIDFFGGQRDLREKTIRVLHNLSYVEDPTRAFRAIRFAERFGFKLSKHTENLISSALKMNLFEKLSGSRLYDELHIAFHETNPLRTLKRLAEHNLLSVIQRELLFNDRLEQTLSAMYETIAWYNLLYLEEKADTPALYLMALLSQLDEKQRQEALQRLAVPPKVQGMIVRGTAASVEILKGLPAQDPAALYHHLHHVPIETLLFCLAVTRDEDKKKDISHFLVEQRKVKPLLTGQGLKKLGIPPGPLYTKILRAILDEKLRGKLKTEESERRFVQRHYRRAELPK